MVETIHKDVYWLLRKTTKHVKSELRLKVEGYGISWQQFHALYHIGENGIPSNELAKELNCNASNMTGLIDRMMEKDWVFREQSKEDRRVWLVKLTTLGSRMKDEVYPKHQENIKKQMSVLSEEELVTLSELLVKLNNQGGNRNEGI